VSAKASTLDPYLDCERDYKWKGRERRDEALNPIRSRTLLAEGSIQNRRSCCAFESRSNLLFSFEKMALRDAVKSPKAIGFAGAVARQPLRPSS
jgi:hypothetical protein